MINLCCISTSKNTDKILQQIKDRYSDQIRIVLHLGSSNSDFKASTIRRMNIRQGHQGHLFSDAEFTGCNSDFISSDLFQKSMFEFVDHMLRSSSLNTYRSHELIHIYDYYDYYHIVTDVLAKKLIDCKVTHLLFFNIPHLAFDTVLYHLARSMGIPCVIVTQSLFPGRFFSMNSPDDNGFFRSSNQTSQPYKIEKGKSMELFYMKDIKQRRGGTGKINLKAMLNLFLYLWNRRPLSAFNPFFLFITLQRMKRIYGYFPDWRDPFANFFHEDSLAYFEHIAQFENNQADYSKRFVYFPLQLQPEMTTSALGKEFVDQAYAIEKLSSILPNDVLIYVKENPKQGAFMRGPMFFQRLKRIKKVKILASYEDTHALQQKSECVATITGTAAWEAVCKGKRALVFGNSWHQSLPGVIKWRADLTYVEILSTKVDHDALERCVGNLLAKSHQGVVDRHYEQLVEEFNTVSNAVNVADTIFKLITAQIPTTFEAIH